MTIKDWSQTKDHLWICINTQEGVFSEFIFKPENCQKSQKIDLEVLQIFQRSFRKENGIIYKLWNRHSSPISSTKKPLVNQFTSTLNINLLRMSTTSAKRKGERGYPCLKLLDPLTKPLSLPLARMRKLVEERQPFIKDLHFELTKTLPVLQETPIHMISLFQNQY